MVKRTSIRSVLETTFGAGNDTWIGIALILFGSLCSSLMGAAVYELITQRTGHSWKALAIIASVAGVGMFIVAAIVVLIVTRLAKRKRPKLGEGDVISPARALVVFVSLPPGNSHEIAYTHHTRAVNKGGSGLQALILLHSMATESRDAAWQFRNRVTAEQSPPLLVEPRLLPRLYDIRSCYRTINEEIDRLLSNTDIVPPLRPEEVVLDVTGGSAMFTSAGVLAALGRELALEYVEPGTKTNGGPDYTQLTVKPVPVDWAPIEEHAAMPAPTEEHDPDLVATPDV